LNALFTALSQAMTANLWLAMAASFGWGVCSILLSPCHLSSIPLIIGFLSSQQVTSVKRAFALSTLFAAGIVVTIAIIGAITAVMGKMLGDIGPYGKYIVGALFIAVGLYLMGIIRLPDLGLKLRAQRTGSIYLTSLALGLVFGLALGPCTFAFLAPVLGVVFELAGKNLPAAMALLLAFAIGHCLVIISVGMAATRIQAYLDWSNRSTIIVWIKRVAGGLVIAGGIYSFATAY
jgi:cytochrome c-type biogenesis protein